MITGADLVLVGLSDTEPGHEQLPDATATKYLHGMATAIPVIKITNHADAFR